MIKQALCLIKPNQTTAGKLILDSYSSSLSLQMLTKLMGGRNPLLYSYQGSLPKLPVPTLDGTMQRYLRSVQPLMDEEKYKRMEKLVEQFRSGIGPKLQRYLNLKSWWATNYVSGRLPMFSYLKFSFM